MQFFTLSNLSVNARLVSLQLERSVESRRTAHLVALEWSHVAVLKQVILQQTLLRKATITICEKMEDLWIE
jgi:hypothetical protein